VIINPYIFGSVPPLHDYATLNPADIGSNLTLSSGNLEVTTSGSTWTMVRADQGKDAGKWVWEATNIANGAANGAMIVGFVLGTDTLATFPGSGAGSNMSMGWQANNITAGGTQYQNGFLGVPSPGGTSIGPGGSCMLAIDLDAGKLWIRNNNTSDWAGGGNPALGTTPSFVFTPGLMLFPAIGENPASQTVLANFGATGFDQAVPSGFNAGWYE